MINIIGLTKKYGDYEVVKDVSFDIEKGKLISIIGPNGAGKSTVLSMITRLSDIDDGSVVIDGILLDKWKNKDLSKKISILRQANDLNLKLTIRELVEFGRFPYSEGNLNDIDKKYVNDAIKYMQLQDIQDKYIDELSGGQRQRAYIAMVIAQDTEYIFLDEPLNNLDMKNCSQMMRVIQSLVKKLNKTVITVIHDINFVSCYSDEIIAMKDGRLYKRGDVKEIIQKEVLEDLYETEFNIQSVEDKKIWVYF